jgi:hypothetical protein
MEIISLELSWFCDIIITSTFHKTTSNTLHNWQFHRIDILFRFFFYKTTIFFTLHLLKARVQWVEKINK